MLMTATAQAFWLTVCHRALTDARANPYSAQARTTSLLTARGCGVRMKPTCRPVAKPARMTRRPRYSRVFRVFRAGGGPFYRNVGLVHSVRWSGPKALAAPAVSRMPFALVNTFKLRGGSHVASKQPGSAFARESCNHRRRRGQTASTHSP